MNHPSGKNPSGSTQSFSDRLREGVFLVVDDFDSMRKVTINQLKQLGAIKFVEAANGAEALKVLERQPITMVLSDWNMPVISGLELLLSIRSNANLFALPFIMITAEAEREQVKLAVQSGVSDLIVKPYTAACLAERVEKTLTRSPRFQRPLDPETVLAETGLTLNINGRPVSGGTEVPTLTRNQIPNPRPAPRQNIVTQIEKPTILVVDDTPDNLTLLSRMFKEEFRVKIAHNGQKALQICQTDAPPDLLLLDIMMPEMDGFEVAQQLRSHPSSEHIPIIFVTAMTGEEARLKGMELGAVDFITKPIDPVALQIRVRNFMRYVDLHRRLQADLDQMMEAEQLKDDVASITRHDMKAPLAGVIGILQGMGNAGNLSDEQRDMLRMAEEAALQALDMINLSNELYKMEAGQFVLDPKPVEIIRTIRRIAELQHKAFTGKNLSIHVERQRNYADEELIAIGDPMLCYSLFQNLIKNACEAAPLGSAITIRVDADTAMRISIANTGAVPMDIRHCFFDKFVTAGKVGGTGLGTYSAKLLAEAQHGSIAMETSDINNTTTVIVTLPIESAPGSQ